MLRLNAREVDRLRDSRVYEVTEERIRVAMTMIEKCTQPFNKLREREARYEDFETASCLYYQAFGTRKCLEMLKRKGKDIPQETIDFFADREAEYSRETKKLSVGPFPDELLSLSPLKLESKFVDERALANINQFGSNAGLICPSTAVALRTPSSSYGEQSGNRSRESEPEPI